MKLKTFVYLVLFIPAVSALFTIPIWAASKNVVQKIELAELDQIMKDDGCRCLIVLMAAWCGPCRKELPVLVKLYDSYAARGLKIVGISLDAEGPKAIQPIVDKLKVDFPVYWVGEQAIRKYGIDALPTLLVIKNGSVLEKIIGKRSETFLKKKIERLLGVE